MKTTEEKRNKIIKIIKGFVAGWIDAEEAADEIESIYFTPSLNDKDIVKTWNKYAESLFNKSRGMLFSGFEKAVKELTKPKEK